MKGAPKVRRFSPARQARGRGSLPRRSCRAAGFRLFGRRDLAGLSSLRIIDLAFSWVLPSADLGSGCHAAPLRGVPQKAETQRRDLLRSARALPLAQLRDQRQSLWLVEQGSYLLSEMGARGRGGSKTNLRPDFQALARREPWSLEVAGTRPKISIISKDAQNTFS